MGFYYGPGTPPEDDKPGGIKDALYITIAVFRVLALPLGILFGVLGYLVLLVFLFGIHPLAGLAGILVVVAAVGLRALWELWRPPTLEDL